ncbi:MAG TPA: hypothetical protein VMB50_23300 [Myxococcales bacterium]|nr:hypothetical protein [Myxococcales bacterium]
MIAALVTLLLAAGAPVFRIDPALGDAATLAAHAQDAWSDLTARYEAATGAAPSLPGRPLQIVADPALPGSWNGASRPGIVGLRPGSPADPAFDRALRHELAHQLLWAACPAASADRLFHEAFAVAASGQLQDWADGPYLSLGAARAELARVPSLDGPTARRALARMLSEWHPGSDGLPEPLHRRLERCASGATWTPLTAAELDVRDAFHEGDAFVVVSRHSGEILELDGEARRAMPFGSTLKPFVLAAADRWPKLRPRAGQPEWACGTTLPPIVDGPTALLRSCNGYFLDWDEAAPFGAYGPLLARLGLGRAPARMSEAIGLAADLAISPLGLAEGYRFLAEGRPDILALMRRNALQGTLAGLPASAALRAVATKTGTVRDSTSEPRLGWIVAVDDDVVAVMTRAGRAPRTFAEAFATALRTLPRAATGPARVQTFGLVDPGPIRVACEGVPAVVTRGGPVLPAGPDAGLLDLVRQGPALCLGAPWSVHWPGIGPRSYAGVFKYSPAPAEPGPDRAARARRGSDFVFRTTLGRYVAGVLEAEDGDIASSARRALARVVAANVRHSRHGRRPVCDTTHCQVFLGTRPPRPADLDALAQPELQGGWRLFSRGGDEPWTQEVEAKRVDALLGDGARDLRFSEGQVRFDRTERGAQGWYDEALELGCERLRAPLRLPSCPDSAERVGDRFVFVGHGSGHGQGLDVEWAKRSGLSADAILRHAYGDAVLGRGP